MGHAMGQTHQAQTFSRGLRSITAAVPLNSDTDSRSAAVRTGGRLSMIHLMLLRTMLRFAAERDKLALPPNRPRS